MGLGHAPGAAPDGPPQAPFESARRVRRKADIRPRRDAAPRVHPTPALPRSSTPFPPAPPGCTRSNMTATARLVAVANGTAKVFTRTGLDWTDKFAGIAAAPKLPVKTR